MAKGLHIEVRGLNKLMRKIGEIPQTIRDETDALMSAASNNLVNKAVESAPIDQGILKSQITFKRQDEMKYEVVSGASWSAFIEFGTKSRVKVPAEFAAYAAQFKGKGRGQPGKRFYDSILAWVKRKKITGTYNVKTRRRDGSAVDRQIEDEQTAFAIYLSIMRHGVKPHPFFFVHVPAVRTQFEKGMKQVIKKALRR